jgi:hypothetical protein
VETITGPPAPVELPSKIAAAARGTNLYRTPARVGLLAFVGFLTYPFWWNWQLLKFSSRERFPRARSFWWTLVPIYGFVVIWQQLDDLMHAGANKGVRVRAGRIIALLVGGTIAIRFARVGSGLTVAVIALVVSSLLTTLGIYLAQRSIVAYLATTYPTERRRRVSVSEIVATLLTLLIFGSAAGLAYYWNIANAGPVVRYMPAASPMTDATLAGGWTQYRDSASDFIIQLPPGWASVRYDAEARGDPPTRLIKFYAEANDKSADLVVTRWISKPISLDDYVAEHEAALWRSGATAISHTPVTLPIGQSELFRFSRTFSDADGALTDHFIEYVIVSNQAFRTVVYRIQFAADAVTQALENTAQSIAATFRLL